MLITNTPLYCGRCHHRLTFLSFEINHILFTAQSLMLTNFDIRNVFLKKKLEEKKRKFFNKNKFNLAHLTNCLRKMLRLIDATSHFEFTIYTKIIYPFQYTYEVCVRDIKMWQSR